MFTWVCPQCGREVPPSYEACPDCAARAKAGETQPAPIATTPTAAPPPAYMASAVEPGAPSGLDRAAGSHAGLPTWLLAILFAFAFVGVGASVYFAVQYFRGGTQAASTPASPGAGKTSAKQNPLQKYVEVSGIRFVESPKHQIEARFVVINHSDADITDLGGLVNIWGRTVKSEEEAAGSFTFKIATLKPNESQEAAAPLSTKLKVYELPDWQNVSADVQITSP